MQNDKEIWKVVPDTDGKYEVSDQGRIRTMWRLSRHRQRYQLEVPKVLDAIKTPLGYLRIALHTGEQNKSIGLHRLILMTFKSEGYRPELHAAHINGIRDDNRLENLMWATIQENADHKFAHGITNKGEKNRQAKLNEAAARAVKRLAEAGIPQKIIADAFGIAEGTVSHIKMGDTWKHL